MRSRGTLGIRFRRSRAGSRLNRQLGEIMYVEMRIGGDFNGLALSEFSKDML